MSGNKLSLELFTDVLRDILSVGRSDVEVVLERFSEKQLLSSEHTTDVMQVLTAKHVQTVFLIWAKFQNKDNLTEYGPVISKATHNVMQYWDSGHLPENYTEIKTILQPIAEDLVDEIEEEAYIYFSALANTLCDLK